MPIKDICYQINIWSACIFFCGLSVRFNYRLMSNEIVDFVVQENVWQLCERGLCRTVNFCWMSWQNFKQWRADCSSCRLFFVFSVFFVGFH